MREIVANVGALCVIALVQVGVVTAMFPRPEPARCPPPVEVTWDECLDVCGGAVDVWAPDLCGCTL